MIVFLGIGSTCMFHPYLVKYGAVDITSVPWGDTLLEQHSHELV